MTNDNEIAKIVAGLSDLEREWITGWQGVAGAAFNVVATDLLHKKLLVGPLDWNLNKTGHAVRDALQREK